MCAPVVLMVKYADRENERTVHFTYSCKELDLRLDREVPSSPSIIYPSAIGSYKNGIISLACRAHGR